MGLKTLFPAVPALYYGWQYYCFSSPVAVDDFKKHKSHALSEKVKGILKNILNPDLNLFEFYEDKEFEKLDLFTEGFSGKTLADRINPWIDSSFLKVVAGRPGALPLSSFVLFDQSNRPLSTIFINGKDLTEPALFFAVGRESYHLLQQTAFHRSVIKLALATVSFAIFSTLKKFASPSFLKYWPAASLLTPFIICQIADVVFSLKREIGADLYALTKLKQKFSHFKASDSALYFLQEVAVRKSESLWERFKFFVYQPAIETRMVYLENLIQSTRYFPSPQNQL